jgi:hypothetical protein
VRERERGKEVKGRRKGSTGIEGGRGKKRGNWSVSG